jgi:hypothetical protein
MLRLELSIVVTTDNVSDNAEYVIVVIVIIWMNRINCISIGGKSSSVV